MPCIPSYTCRTREGDRDRRKQLQELMMSWTRHIHKDVAACCARRIEKQTLVSYIHTHATRHTRQNISILNRYRVIQLIRILLHTAFAETPLFNVVQLILQLSYSSKSIILRHHSQLCINVFQVKQNGNHANNKKCTKGRLWVICPSNNDVVSLRNRWIFQLHHIQS